MSVGTSHRDTALGVEARQCPCQKEGQNILESQIVCQSRCQRECHKRCQNKWHNPSRNFPSKRRQIVWGSGRMMSDNVRLKILRTMMLRMMLLRMMRCRRMWRTMLRRMRVKKIWCNMRKMKWRMVRRPGGGWWYTEDIEIYYRNIFILIYFIIIL